jgi:hypothetical protein
MFEKGQRSKCNVSSKPDVDRSTLFLVDRATVEREEGRGQLITCQEFASYWKVKSFGARDKTHTTVLNTLNVIMPPPPKAI